MKFGSRRLAGSASLCPLVMLFTTSFVVGCAVSGPTASRPYSAPVDGPGDRSLVVAQLNEQVRDLPKSRTGNPAQYTVFGREYKVMDSSEGHVEEGLASWYGRKFHGRLTSSGEPYDMHAMTAAHKSMPLPTFVSVTRIDTGASVIVKVNDRGPFVDDRIIDLSYAAAVQLDMLDSGTAPVRMEALSTHLDDKLQAQAERELPVREAKIDEPPVAAASGRKLAVLQFGAFASSQNAEALQAQLDPVLDIPVIIVEDISGGLYRVQSGPLIDQRSLNAVLSSLNNAGIDHEAVLRRLP